MLLDIQDTTKAVHLAQKVEQNMAKHNKRKEYIAMVQKVVVGHKPGTEFLEYLTHVYNSANRESDFCATLNQLFQLYYAAGNFLKAGEALDRICDVNPYDPGNAKNLDLLKGKLDNNRFNAIANRLQQVGAGSSAAVEGDGGGGGAAAGAKEEAGSETTVLEDFILQAEIFMQYGMRSKAIERLERIHKVFPREEDKNERLKNLYNNAGFVPKYETPAAPPPPPPGTPVSPFGAPPTYGGGGAPTGTMMMPQLSNDENAVDNFARVTEITRNIYRQSTVKGVLFAAVNDVGRHYNASRCVAGLISPGKQPNAALEYCAPGIKQSDVQHIVKLLSAVQNLSVQVGNVALDNAPESPGLQDALPSLQALGVKSLMAAPLKDASTDEHVGLLLLEQCDKNRQWRTPESVVLKTIADQMVLAVNNAKLRSLMKNLAVTDEKSGLLKRASYLDVLLGETRRALTQNSTACLMLLSFGKASALAKEIGEPGVDSMMQQIGQTLLTQVRQNDVCIRYDTTTVAVILPDTNDKNAFFVVEKMRKTFAMSKVPGTDRGVDLTVGIAEMVMQAQFDPIDIVTEVINRADSALDAARAEGPNAAKSLAPVMEAAAA
jgi:diguanylate cyclase (GGDEF)-like protein